MKIDMIYKPIFVLIFCLFCILKVKAQYVETRCQVYGKIIDARTKKGIKRIPITVFPFNRVVNADNKGQFLFNMPRGSYSIVIDYYPFDKQEVKLNLQSDTTLLIELHSPFTSQYIEEVEVISSKPATEMPAAIEQIDKHTLKVMPAMIGERDILKTFTLTSGVTSSSEGAADMQVRGGLHGQNLYLLDGIPLYSTEHFFGLVSVYNPTIIKSAKLYKSDFPAEYGGKVSSVVNVLTEDANLKKFKGEAEIGILSSKVALNIPIVNDKMALTVAGRLSNYSLFNIISPFIPERIGVQFNSHFGDINTNMLWKLSEKDKLKLSFFSNTDGIEVRNGDNKFWIKNKQQNLGLNWFSTFSGKVENQLFVYADSYGYDFGNSSQNTTINSKQITQILTGITSSGLVEKCNYKFSDKLSITGGASIKMVVFSPYQINKNDSNIEVVKPTDIISQTEGVVFSEGQYMLNKQHRLTGGMRFSAVGNTDKIYSNIEPRIGYHGILKNDYSISASVGRMTQPIHRVANSGLGFPFEIFLPSSNTILPESSWNLSLGGAKNIVWNKKTLSFRADVWYKIMQHIVEFQDGYDAVFTTIIAPQPVVFDTKRYVTQGNGMAYGIDFSADYSVGKWRLKADYTLMTAENQFNDLNSGRPFAAPTDIRNSLTFSSELKLSETWSFSATWQFRSGKPITVPTYIFVNPLLNAQQGVVRDYEGSDFQRVVTDRNNYRTKTFHKLDISFLHNYKTRRHHRDATLTLGIYNLYNQANPFLYYIDGVQNPDKSFTPVLKSMSLFPILPSFSWSMKF